MAKKSFILFNDSLSVLDELTDDQAGKLFKAIRNYQNGVEEELEFGLKMAFLPFKNQFVRDMAAWEELAEVNRIKGLKSAEARAKKAQQDLTDSTAGSSGRKKPTESTYKVTVTDTVKDKVTPPDIYSDFIDLMKKYTGRKFRGDEPSKKSFAARIKGGYTLADFETALKNVQNDDFHKGSGYKYITPEFMTREDKLTKFMVEVNTSVMESVVQPGQRQDAPRTFEKISDED